MEGNIKVEAKINEIKKYINKVNESKSLFFEKINITDKPLARLTDQHKKERRYKLQNQE